MNAVIQAILEAIYHKASGKAVEMRQVVGEKDYIEKDYITLQQLDAILKQFEP